jgi:predicted porin
MPNKYLLAIPFLFVAGFSAAEEQKNNTATAITRMPIYTFGGFGSLGVSHSSMKQGDYVLDSSMPKGVGRSSDWWLGNNTRITAHVTADFTPKVSAILQVDSEYRTDGSYAPEIEWLNVKYAFTPNIHVRLGRIALPTFIDSENRDVGYSYVWVNTPVDLYHQLSIPNSDGVDVTYRAEIGDAGNTLKAIYGTNTLERPNSETISRDMWGLFDTFEYGSATFHISYQHRRTSTTSFRTGLTGEWTQNSDLSVGASYDPGDWFVISEWMQRRSTTKIGAMYVSGGYRIDKFTPYLLYSQNSPGSFYAYSTPPSAGAVDRAKRSQSTISLGMRWDFMRNYDFKIQYDQVKLGDNSNGYLVNVPPGVTLYGSKFHVISAVVDFVF